MKKMVTITKVRFSELHDIRWKKKISSLDEKKKRRENGDRLGLLVILQKGGNGREKAKLGQRGGGSSYGIKEGGRSPEGGTITFM